MSALAPVETQLFVYGTLAPGRANEHQLASLQGTWEKAWVKGHLFEEGWGIAQGFPGIRLDIDALRYLAGCFDPETYRVIGSD